jgi:hypothetical protein
MMKAYPLFPPGVGANMEKVGKGEPLEKLALTPVSMHPDLRLLTGK